MKWLPQGCSTDTAMLRFFWTIPLRFLMCLLQLDNGQNDLYTLYLTVEKNRIYSPTLITDVVSNIVPHTLNSCKELKVVPSKRFLQFWNFIGVLGTEIKVCKRQDHIGPGSQLILGFCAVLRNHTPHFHSLHLSEWRFRSNKRHNMGNKSLGHRQMIHKNEVQESAVGAFGE